MRPVDFDEDAHKAFGRYDDGLPSQLAREATIARMEAEGRLDPDCDGCRKFYDHPRLDPFAPRHKASSRCQSGGRPHCTCDICF